MKIEGKLISPSTLEPMTREEAEKFLFDVKYKDDQICKEVIYMAKFTEVICQKEGKGWILYYKNTVMTREVKQEIASLIFASLPVKKVKKKVYDIGFERNGRRTYYRVTVA